jgi:hypothetical protein
MDTDKIWIVLGLLLLILVVSNGLMFAIARGIRSDAKWLDKMRDAAQPWKKEDENWRELSRRVRDLQDPAEKKE